MTAVTRWALARCLGRLEDYRGSAEQDVMDVLAEVRRDYKIDPNRIYLMGHSMGAYGTWSIAMAHPELFAALGPISGGGSTAGMAKIRDIPQYVVHGDNESECLLPGRRPEARSLPRRPVGQDQLADAEAGEPMFQAQGEGRRA